MIFLLFLFLLLIPDNLFLGFFFVFFEFLFLNSFFFEFFFDLLLFFFFFFIFRKTQFFFSYLLSSPPILSLILFSLPLSLSLLSLSLSSKKTKKKKKRLLLQYHDNELGKKIEEKTLSEFQRKRTFRNHLPLISFSSLSLLFLFYDWVIISGDVSLFPFLSLSHLLSSREVFFDVSFSLERVVDHLSDWGVTSERELSSLFDSVNRIRSLTPRSFNRFFVSCLLQQGFVFLFFFLFFYFFIFFKNVVH